MALGQQPVSGKKLIFVESFLLFFCQREAFAGCLYEVWEGQTTVILSGQSYLALCHCQYLDNPQQFWA